MAILVESLIAVDWKDSNLWLAMAVVITHTVFLSYVKLWERESRRLKSVIGKRKQVICTFILLLELARFFLVTSAMESQPRWLYLQENTFLVLGHLILVTGVVLIITSARMKGIGLPQFLVCNYFGFGAEDSNYQFPFNILCESVSAATILIFFGISLLQASQAGVILTLLIGLSSNCRIEQFLPRTFRIRSINPLK